jgi:hypothetical protein
VIPTLQCLAHRVFHIVCLKVQMNSFSALVAMSKAAEVESRLCVMSCLNVILEHLASDVNSLNISNGSESNEGPIKVLMTAFVWDAVAPFI